MTQAVRAKAMITEYLQDDDNHLSFLAGLRKNTTDVEELDILDRLFLTYLIQSVRGSKKL